MRTNTTALLQSSTAWQGGGVQLKPIGAGRACMRWRIDVAASLPRELSTAGVAFLWRCGRTRAAAAASFGSRSVSAATCGSAQMMAAPSRVQAQMWQC
jgi:hypothetical protein